MLKRVQNPEVLSIAYKCSKGSTWDLCCNHNTVAQQTLFIDALLYPIEITQFISHTPFTFIGLCPLLLPRTCSTSRGKVIGVGVHIYMFVDKKIESTLTIDSPFQTFAVELLIKFRD